MNYDHYWRASRSVADPIASPIWNVIAPYVSEAQRRLEIGAGMRPKFPLEGTTFLEQSTVAVARMGEMGLDAVVHDAGKPFPFHDGTFDLVGAFEVLEHIPDDRAALREIARVLKPGGRFVFSAPVHARYWSAWDSFVGHQRRYDPRELLELLRASGFFVEKRCDLVSFASRFQKTALYRIIAAAAVFVAQRTPNIFSRLIYDRAYASLAALGALNLKKKGGLVCCEGVDVDDAQHDTSNILVVCRKQDSPG